MRFYWCMKVKSMSSLKLSLRYVSVVSKRQSSSVKSDFFDFIHYTGTTSETTYKSYSVFKSYYDQPWSWKAPWINVA